jgi:SAM-dependent methyltransferase
LYSITDYGVWVVEMNCDFIAPWYGWLEYASFGRALQRRRLEFLHEIENAQTVLILGDGDGRFTEAFVKRNRSATVDSVDSSAGMKRLVERRLRKAQCDAGRVRLIVADARTTELSGTYELIITHFFLDCFTSGELELLVARVSRAACPGARWVVSEFQIPQGRLQWLAVYAIQALYLGFRILTGLKTNRLPDYAAALKSAGYECVNQKKALGGLLVSQMWQQRTQLITPFRTA